MAHLTGPARPPGPVSYEARQPLISVEGMELGACRAGAVARIVRVDVEPAVRLRFGELGLRAGALVQVTHDVGGQGRVVAVGADRFALDAATCARITVEPASAR